MVVPFPVQATLPECERFMSVNVTIPYAFRDIDLAIATLMDELMDPTLTDAHRTLIQREAQRCWLALAAIESTAINQFGQKVGA